LMALTMAGKEKIYAMFLLSFTSVNITCVVGCPDG